MKTVRQKAQKRNHQTNSNLNQPRMHLLRPLSALSISIPALAYSSPAFAAQTETAKSLSEGMMPLIRLIQDFAYPVGVGIALWGVIEYMLDSPSGKHRVKLAFVGYIAIFIIPYIFAIIRETFEGMLR